MTDKLTQQIPQHITDLVAAGALFVLNHSGGKDSQAMFAYVTRQVPADQIVVVHADLGRMEWAGVQDHIRASIGGYDLNVVRAGKDLLEMVGRRQATLQAAGKDAPPWPSAQYRQCTSDLKRGPVAKFTRHYVKASGHRLVVNCLGLRAEESAARAKRPAFRTITRECTRVRTVVEWLPIQDWTIDQVWQAIADSGQMRHWAYDKGMSRLSCCFCILASKADLTIAARENPDLYREYVQLEKSTGYTMRAGASLEQITGINITAALAA
jgi:3'-phosphoadenosine 5'-phosphosulfate sulfotransferase (PAPS reductase)/FAD synthetase